MRIVNLGVELRAINGLVVVVVVQLYNIICFLSLVATSFSAHPPQWVFCAKSAFVWVMLNILRGALVDRRRHRQLERSPNRAGDEMHWVQRTN